MYIITIHSLFGSNTEASEPINVIGPYLTRKQANTALGKIESTLDVTDLAYDIMCWVSRVPEGKAPDISIIVADLVNEFNA